MTRPSGLTPERMAIIEQGMREVRAVQAKHAVKAQAAQFGVGEGTVRGWRAKVRVAMARRARGVR